MKFTPPGTPAPMRKKQRPSSLKKLRELLLMRQSMGPICPKCPIISPAIRVPPDEPREKLIHGIFMLPMRLPKTIVRAKGKKPWGSIA